MTTAVIPSLVGYVEMSSSSVAGTGSRCRLSREASRCDLAADRMVTEEGSQIFSFLSSPVSHSGLPKILVAAPIVVGTMTNSGLEIIIVYSPFGT